MELKQVTDIRTEVNETILLSMRLRLIKNVLFYVFDISTIDSGKITKIQNMVRHLRATFAYGP